jgi:hypothetical protein
VAFWSLKISKYNKLGYNKNMAILNDDEFVEVEGRSYLKPEVALDESNKFIDNLRETQQANNQQIQTDTYNLGTAVPSHIGGLTGAGSYFTNRYQVPQTNTAVSDLRATAQAAALNQALQNEQDIWKKKYNEAYRSYQKRSNSGNGGNGGSGGNNSNSSSWDGQVKKNNTKTTAMDTITLESNTEGDTGRGITWTVEPSSVGTKKLVFRRTDTTKSVDDPDYESWYEQQEDGTLKRFWR